MRRDVQLHMEGRMASSSKKKPFKKDPEAIKIDCLNAWCHGQDAFHDGSECQYDFAKQPEAFEAWQDGYNEAALEHDREHGLEGAPRSY